MPKRKEMDCLVLLSNDDDNNDNYYNVLFREMCSLLQLQYILFIGTPQGLLFILILKRILDNFTFNWSSEHSTFTHSIYNVQNSMQELNCEWLFVF